MFSLLCGSFCILEKVGDRGLTKQEQAERDYMSGMKYKDIAEKYGTTINTVKSWKKRYAWNRKGGAPKGAKGCTQNKKNATTPQLVVYDGTKETLQNEELTPEQQMFCIYYIRTFNATQSYQKAYGCSHESAMCAGSRLLSNVRVRKEIERLKEIKRQNIVASPDDIVELQMRIAFADIGNYAKFMNDGMGNVVQVSNSALVDTQIIQEVKEGKAGVSIKLADRQKAIDWLTAHFMMNPMDEHKAEFDKKRLELEYLKLDAQIEADEVADEDSEDNFLEALNAAATEVWGDEDGLE